MKRYVRTETKEVELLGVSTEKEEMFDQREGKYIVEKYYCTNCKADLTEDLEDNDINYCQCCGQDLVRGVMPVYTRKIDTSKTSSGVTQRKI